MRVANHNGVSRRHDYHDDELNEGAKSEEDGDCHVSEETTEVDVIRLLAWLL